MNLFEDESIIISRLLDKMGYGQTMNFLRKEFFSEMARYCSGDGCYVQFCGSKGEGMSKLLESDMDLLRVATQIISTECVWNYANCGTKIVFYLDTEQSSPGYTMLRLIFNSPLNVFTFNLANENLVQLPRGRFLSAEGWKQSLTNAFTRRLDRQGNLLAQQIGHWSGSSITSFQIGFGLSIDNVVGIECECPPLLNEWINRPRSNSWPSPDLVRAVSETRAHVVPVGNAGSTYHLLEWRICFTEAELILIYNLNPCYQKALILLKAVTKRTLKTICRNITSYVVKNVVLWIAENDSRETVPETKLFALFQQALKFLKTCIWKNNLPSYMIEQRNLFADRLTRRSRLFARIDFLLKEGPRAILKCGTVKHYLEMFFYTPELLRRKLLRLRALEIYIMEYNILLYKKFTLGDINSLELANLYRISDEDLILLTDRYDALWQSLAVEQTEYISEEDILSSEITAESCAYFARKHFPLLWGL